MSTQSSLDSLTLKRMRTREKASLLRQRLIDLGIDLECRRIRGISIVSSGVGSVAGKSSKNGDCYRLPPSHELEILFTNSPLLCLVWDHFLLRVWPESKVNLCKKNLRVKKAKRDKSEAKNLKAEQKRERGEVIGKLDAINEKIAIKTKKLNYLALERSEVEAGKSREMEEKLHSSISATSLKRLSQSLASQFARREREESDKWEPTARKLEDYRQALQIAGGEARATTSNNLTDCLNQLRVAFQVVKAEICEDLPDGPSSTSADKGVTDLSLDPSETESQGFRHLDLLDSILRSHSREDILAAFIEETQSKSRFLRRSEANAGFLDPSEASALDCSMDESGIIIDESARRDEKELKHKKEMAKKSLQLKILQIEDEAESCFERAHAVEASRGNRINSNPHSSIRVKALAASQQALKEEIERLQQFVDRVGNEEIELKKKRQILAEVKDAMKLTENIMAALMKELDLRRQQTIDKCEEASQSLDLSSIKKAAKEIGVKSGAMEKYGRGISENWTALKLENLPTRRVESGVTTATGVDRVAGANTVSSVSSVEDSRKALVREVDVSQPLSSPTRKALSRLSVPPDRQSTPFILETLITKEDECRLKEGRISARPCVRSLEPLDEAARVWEAEEKENASATIEAGNKENTHSLSGFKDKSSFMNGSSLSRSALGMEESLSLANQLIGRVMERCVSLAAFEKTLVEERGFEVLDNKIDNKTWTQWKAELKDAVTRHELAGKKS